MSSERTFVIAEAGVNHNGSLDLAMQLVDAAHAAGADAVKFQSFKAEAIATARAAKATYQEKNTESAGSQLEMLRRLEMPEEWHYQLKDRCARLGIEFMSTAFDDESLAFLVERVGIPRIKVPSGEITNSPLLLQMARADLPVIVSTGMSTLGEVESALAVLAFGFLRLPESPSIAGFARAYASPDGQAALRRRVAILHCTSEYPAPPEEVNLSCIRSLREAFGLPVGYSDHTDGIAIPIAATALGSTIIEKHFTLDRDLPGPDHRASLAPDELTAMVSGIRTVEKARGGWPKAPTASEWATRDLVRKSLVARVPIRHGELLTAENLTLKRPGTGTSPAAYWDLLGTRATRHYEKDAPILEGTGVNSE